VDLVVEATGCDACLAYLPDPATDVVLEASQLPHTAEIGALTYQEGEGVTGWVAEHNRRVALGREGPTTTRASRVSDLEEDTYEALLSAPLVAGGEVIGVLNVHHKDRTRHAGGDRAADLSGEQMGGAIVRSAPGAGERCACSKETEEMKRRLEDRTLVERAKGILQQRYRLSEQTPTCALRTRAAGCAPDARTGEAVLLAEGWTRSRPPKSGRSRPRAGPYFRRCRRHHVDVSSSCWPVVLDVVAGGRGMYRKCGAAKLRAGGRRAGPCLRPGV